MLEKEHISINELGNLFRCEKQFEFRYIDRLPAVYNWGFNFYAGKKVETIVKASLQKKEPEAEVKAMLVQSGFIKLKDNKLDNIMDVLERRIAAMADMILEKLPGFRPGTRLISPFGDDPNGNTIVLEGWPDFVNDETQAVVELKISNKAPSIYDIVGDAIQLASYSKVLKFSKERSHLFYGLISQAGKPRTPELRLLTYSMEEIQKMVQFDIDKEVDLLFSRLMILRYSKTFERTGLVKDACSFCSYKHLCYQPSNEEGTEE